MNRPIAMTADGLERHRFSTADIDRMIEAGVLEAEGRWELLDGEIVPMAATYTPHGRMTMRLGKWIDGRLDPSKFELFGGVTVELGETTRVDPDLFVVRSGLTTKIVPAKEVLWAIEVSDATRLKDLKVKARLYAAAGVPEYWVVDLEDRMTHIHRGPSQSGWTEPIVAAPFDEEIAPRMFPDLKLTLAALQSS